MVRLAQALWEDRILDLCCGTGDLAEIFHRRGNRKIVGLDFNRPMLSIAYRRSHENANHCIQYACGDALRLPFLDNSFRVVAIGYGLRNLSNIDNALSEIMRVTQAGGRIMILEFGKPDNAILRKIYFSYLKFVIPIFGRLFFRNANFYAYILKSLNNYPGQTDINLRLAKLGCKSTHIYPILGGMMSINLATCDK